jgi:hypothetical protein
MENDHQSLSPRAETVESLPPLTLTETPGTMSPQPEDHWQPASLSGADDELTDRLYQDMQKAETLHSLNPYKLSLTPQDIESVVALENACFASELAASRDKVRRTQLRHDRN